MSLFAFRLSCLLIPVLLVSCATSTPQHNPSSESVKTYPAIIPLKHVLPLLIPYRAILVGEQHDRADHHEVQLEVIKTLYAHNPEHLVIGLEFIQQPFQDALDRYINHQIDEKTLLQETQYFKRWRYDYRLYAGIFRYAKENKIPLLALNIPSEITRQTANEGLASLNAQQQAYIPKHIDREVVGYIERIQGALDKHPEKFRPDLQNFVDAQLLWDEGMAAKAAEYLIDNPRSQMVILAGAGHVIDRSGIATRLQRRIKMPVATLINILSLDDAYHGMADYITHTEPTYLPPKGYFGILMEQDDEGVKVVSFVPNSAAENQGVLVDDYFSAIGGVRIKTTGDVALAMWDKNVGDEVEFAVSRGSEGVKKVIVFSIVLR